MFYRVAKTLIEILQFFWLKQSKGRVWDNYSHWEVKGGSRESEGAVINSVYEFCPNVC